MRLVHFHEVGNLAIDILEGIATGVNGVNLGTPTFSYTDSNNVTTSNAPVNPGTYIINASFAGNANYLPGSNSSICPVGVGRLSPSPTGAVGLTTIAPAASARRSASSFVRLYGTASSHSGGESSSVA